MIRRYAAALGLAVLVVAFDLWTKRLAAMEFVDSTLDVVPGFLRFTFVENRGAAFGMFQNGGAVIAVAAIIITVVILFSLARPRPRLEVVALGLIIGGALGNLVDRVARGDGLVDGPVIDWIDLWIIPTFNVADASITVAVALLLIQAWINR